MSTVSYAIWAFAAGALIPLMALLNAGIARTTGGQIQATIILFAVGLIASLLLALIVTVPVPDLHTLLHVAPQQYAGGVIVGFYVLSITYLAPRFGVGNAILFVVMAQLITSALMDHFGLAGAALRPVTMMRAVGLLIVIIGVVVTQISDRPIGAMR
jgi:bacterial/archaeal transporter family-2 protein